MKQNNQKSTPVQVTGKHTFTQEERDTKLSELLAAIQRKEELDAEKKQVMSGYKNKLDEQESNIKVISNLLNMGFEHRPFSCYLTKDFEAGKRFYHEVGSGLLISTESLTASDYQTEIDLEEAKIKENNKLADQLQMVIEDKVEEAGMHVVTFEQDAQESASIEAAIIEDEVIFDSLKEDIKEDEFFAPKTHVLDQFDPEEEKEEDPFNFDV